jgi:hypothetical protein
MRSILTKTPTLEINPYPHFVIEDALPDDLYDHLEREWPTEQLLNTQPFDGGICFRLKADEMLKPSVVPNVWREFTEYHTSPEFFKQVAEVFGDLMPEVQEVENTLSPRGWDKGQDFIGTDCQAVMHKPVDYSSRTPHIDNPREIYAGLLYMPYNDDESKGGEFQIHETQNKITEVNKSGGREVPDGLQGRIVKRVPYTRNTFVMFLNNSSRSVHSVSARENPTTYRRSVNIIAEFNKVANRSMFNVKEYRK